MLPFSEQLLLIDAKGVFDALKPGEGVGPLTTGVSTKDT